jgi:hypothetical protein
VKRTFFRLLDLAVAVGLVLAIASIGQVRIPEGPSIRESDKLWPPAPLGDAKRPDGSDDEFAKLDAGLHARPALPSRAAALAPTTV